MVSHPGGAPIMDVDRINDLFVVSVYDGISMNDFRGFGSPNEVVMTIGSGDEHEHNTGGTL